jgi:ribosomal protein S7
MAIFSLKELREAVPPELRGLSDDALLRDYSQRVGKTFEETADYFGYKPRGTLSEMGRQLVGGAVVDLPKMVGQSLEYTGLAPEYGREMAQAAEARAVDYVPDMRGRGLVGQAGVLGSRAVAPMAPAIAASFLPGGQVAAPVVAAGLFGTSSAQETYDKLREQGVSEEDATAAARRVGLIQGPLEGVATATGLRAAKGLAPVLGIGGKTTAGVAAGLTDTAVIKPFAKSMATNMVVQPGTEVLQDLGTYAVEKAYGAKAEDPYEIAKQSALGGAGLTMILGPLSLGGHVARARKADVLQAALSEDAPPEIRAQALKAVTAEARRQGVPESDVGAWFNQQLAAELEFNNRVKQDALNRTVDLMGSEAQQLPFMQQPQAFSSLDQQRQFEQGMSGINLQTPFSSVGQQQQFEQDLMGLGERRVAEVGQQYQDLIGRQASGLMSAQDVGQEWQQQQAQKERGLAAATQAGEQWQEMRAERLKQQFGIEDIGREWQQLAAELPQPVSTGLTKAQRQALLGPKGKRLKQTSSPFAVQEQQAPSASLLTPEPTYSSSLLPQAPAPVSQITERPASPPPGVSPSAVSPAAPVAAGASSTEDAQLKKLLDDVDSVDVKNVLPASVKSNAKAVPGRTSIGQDGLKGIRDALVKGKEVADEKSARIVAALQNFAEAYKKYSDQGGQALSRRNKIAKKKTGAQFAEEAASAIEMQAANVQQALAELGDAVGGNAKDVEAVVRLVKDMVQGKVVAPGKSRGEAIKALQKLDTMLSQAWAAAKREAFMGKEPDTADIRTGAIRTSVEVKGQGKVPKLVQVATEGIKGEGGSTLKGLPAILQYMRTNGTPMERALALALRESIVESQSDIKLEFITEGKPRFDPKTNTVYLNKEESPEVILHEAFHAALQSFVYRNPNNPAVVQLKKSLKAVTGYKGQLTGKALEVQTLLKDLVAKGNELDAVLELVSYGNTLAEFRKALQTMKSDKKVPKSFLESVNKAWEAIKNIATRLLGGKRSLANDVLESSLELLEKAQKQTAVAGQGQVLEAAIKTEKPVSDAKIAAALEVPEQDYSKWSKANAAQLQATQRLFEAVGWSKENAQKMLGSAGDKTRAFISKNFPGAEIVLGWINSRYNVNETVSQIMDRFKLNKGIGYQYAEDLANVIARRPAADVKALFAYLDGNTKALDGLPDAVKLKAVADKLNDWFKLYVAELTPVEQQWFSNRKFSETLLFPSTTEQVAGGTFGLGKINEVLGIKTEREAELDQDWFRKDENGDLILTGDMYRVFEPNRIKNNGEMISAGFMSASRFAELGGKNPMGFTVDTSRRWTYGGVVKGKHTFTTNTTAKEKIDNEKADDVANALRNTVAALANNYASKNFIKSIYDMGRGNSAHAQVAFDSLEAVNKFMNEGVPADQRVVIREDMVLPVSREISRSPQTKALYRQSGTWVKLPESGVYGELSGKYIPGPVWNAMGDMSDRQPLVNLRAVNNTMRWFKKSKTVWNFGTHVTNTASNVTMAMMHDISFGTMRDAAKMLAKYEVNAKALTKEELDLVMAFRDSGAMLADYSSAEVKEAIYKAHEQNLRGGEDVSLMRRVGGWLGVEKSKAEWLQAQAKKVGKGVEYIDEVSTQMYAAEDNIFRMAAFLKTAGALQQRAGAKTPSAEMLQEAGLFARKAFGDYDIDSKAVKIARQTALPFVSWFYAMAPVIGRIAVYEPWKLVNVLGAYMILEAAMAGAAGGDDEETRKEGPESIRERMFGSIGPYLHIRIPFMGDEENPVYYKLGDYFPLASFTRGLPNGVMGQSWIPASLTPSGPFVSALLGLVGGVDPYTGKALHKPTDTEWQKLWTSTKFAYDIMTLPVISTRNIGKVDDIIEGKTGITGNEPSSLPIARAFGFKFYDYNVNEQAAINEIVVKRIERDFKTAMTQAKRDEYRKAYPDYDALDEKLDDLQTRMEKEIEKARGGAEE